MNNDWIKCYQCERIAAECCHRHTELPDDGTDCPNGMTRERIKKYGGKCSLKKGRTHSPETRERMSQAQKKRRSMNSVLPSE